MPQWHVLPRQKMPTEPLFTHFDYYALVCRHDSNSPSNLSHFQLDSYGLMNQFYCPQTYEYWINDCLLKQISILCHILIEIMCYDLFLVVYVLGFFVFTLLVYLMRRAPTFALAKLAVGIFCLGKTCRCGIF